MQYKATCYNEECDFGWKTPGERQAFDKIIEHTKETDHVCRLSGVYDSPNNGGFYYGGKRMDVSENKYREIIVLRKDPKDVLDL